MHLEKGIRPGGVSSDGESNFISLASFNVPSVLHASPMGFVELFGLKYQFGALAYEGEWVKFDTADIRLMSLGSFWACIYSFCGSESISSVATWVQIM